MKFNLLISVILFLFILSCKKEAIPPIPPVIADFIYTETTGGKVEFKNLSQNATSYEWDFGNGQNSTSPNVNFTYATNKDYFVTLTAKGLGGQNSKSKTIRVNTVPTVGSVVIWTSFNSNNIRIEVNGIYKGLLTKYVIGDTPPTCDLEGFVTITGPAGDYNFTAKEDKINGSKWAGSFKIINGTCRSQRLLN